MNVRCYYNTLFIGLLTLLSACSFGQGSLKDLKNSTPQRRAEFQTKMMESKLGLDEAQVKKVSVINLKYAEKFQPIIKSKDDQTTKIKQVTTLQGQKDRELQAVFNKQQFAQYQQFEQKIRSRIMARINSQK